MLRSGSPVHACLLAFAHYVCQLGLCERIFPDFFLQQEDHLLVIPDDPVKKDDVNMESQVSGKFNIETGLWDYPALSKHKPKEMMDPQLVNSTLECNEIISSKKLNTST